MIDSIISEIKGLGSEYQIHLSRDASERDIMKILVELGETTPAEQTPVLAGQLTNRIKKKLFVTPAVEPVAYGSLPRSERKSKRIFDTRIQDPII